MILHRRLTGPTCVLLAVVHEQVIFAVRWLLYRGTLCSWAFTTKCRVWSVLAKNIRHFWWLGPNVWWEISQIYIEYTKPIKTNVWWTMQVFLLHCMMIGNQVLALRRPLCKSTQVARSVKRLRPVRDWELLVRTRNFLHISLQINVWISPNSAQDRLLFQLSPEHWCLAVLQLSGRQMWPIKQSGDPDITKYWSDWQPKNFFCQSGHVQSSQTMQPCWTCGYQNMHIFFQYFYVGPPKICVDHST